MNNKVSISLQIGRFFRLGLLSLDTLDTSQVDLFFSSPLR